VIVDALLRSRSTGGEERRGWWGSGAGGATRRKEKGRLGLGRAKRMEDGVGAGLAVGKACCRWRRAPVDDVRVGEERVVHVGRA
jgi:hypothetical protein